MSKIKVDIYNNSGVRVGYFVDPQVECFPQAEYEICGQFFDTNDQLAIKVDFNPEAVPYTADLSSLDKPQHKRLKNVYVKRGRQPIRMTGAA